MTTAEAVSSLLNGASIFPFVLLLGSAVDADMMKAALESSLSIALAGATGLIFVFGEVLSPDSLKQAKRGINANEPAANDSYAEIHRVADALVGDLAPDELTVLRGSAPGNVPKNIDGRLLSSCRDKLQRDLKSFEKKVARSRLLEKAKAKSRA